MDSRDTKHETGSHNTAPATEHGEREQLTSTKKCAQPTEPCMFMFMPILKGRTFKEIRKSWILVFK